MIDINSLPISTPLSAGYEPGYENGVVKTYIDPDCNFFKTLNTTFTSKCYLESDINEIIKYNDDYAKGFSLMHLNVRSLSKDISKLNNYLESLDLK